MARTESTLWLQAGAVLAFNARLPHWTEEGRGALVCASFEFKHQPSEDDVRRVIELRLE
jgi:hypothetical protein